MKANPEDSEGPETEILLNPEQTEAVTWGDGPLVVFAGAGSGKTRVITARIVHLIRQMSVAPSRILGLTFTNKAATEMRERVQAHLPGVRPPFLGTFHSFCARLLRMHGTLIGVGPEFTILDEQDQIAVIKSVLRSLELDPARFAPRAMRNLVERAKREGSMRRVLEGRTGADRMEIIIKIRHAYQERLDRQNGLDFGDLITRAIELLECEQAREKGLAERYMHVLVDEFQDTDRMQARLLTLLAPPPDSSICVVGDDDQSIYRWRGADVRNILDFRKTYPGAHIVKLERNYRSTANILDAALAVISQNTQRAEKTLWTDLGRGDPLVRYDAVSERDEARFVARRIAALAEADVGPGEQAVLYRVHAQSRAIEEALQEASIPYRIVGGVRFYDRAEIRDILSFLRLALNPDDDAALVRVINRPPRGLGAKALETLRRTATRHRCSLMTAAGRVIRSDALTRRARDSLAALVSAIGRWHSVRNDQPPSKIIEEILEDTGYMKALDESREPEAETRALNVRELSAAVREYEMEEDGPTLRGLLERVALSSSTDTGGEDDESVVLMTVHAAKGLEFQSVTVTGLEEDLFPLKPFAGELQPDADQIREELHEERRLFYVAVTRARRHLALTWSRSRRIFGSGSKFRSPSPFLSAIPRGLMVEVAAPRREHSTHPEPESQQQGASLGVRVVHKRFGMGVVVNVQEGVRRKLMIRFDDGKIRKILEDFVHPA